MRKVLILIVLFFGFQTVFAQDSLHLAVIDTLQQPVTAQEKLIIDANYAGGNMEDLYYYINNNFNYNNVKKEDIPIGIQRSSHFIFYVVFAVSEDGKTFEFSPKEIEENNSFYQEAVRVIASTHWNISTEDGIYKKQFLVLPIRANINDL